MPTSPDDYELPLEVMKDYHLVNRTSSGVWVGVRQLMFHWTLMADLTEMGYERRYCYANEADAVHDALVWDGIGDPPGPWHKAHHRSERRDPATDERWPDHLVQPSKYPGLMAKPGDKNEPDNPDQNP